MLRRVEIQSYRHALVKSRLQFYQYSLKYAVAQVLAERDFNSPRTGTPLIRVLQAQAQFKISRRSFNRLALSLATVED